MTAAKREVRTCFAIMPVSVKPDPARGDRVNFDRSVYDNIIGPAVALVGIPMQVVRADSIRAGSIHERMIQHIADADVAIVDITLGNAEVFYELGVRHALRDRVTVLIRRRGTKNPFNFAGLVNIEYDEKKPLPARRAIAAFIRNGLQSSARDSPVYSIIPDLGIELPRAQILEARLFICYRHEDWTSAGRIHDYMTREFGAANVFRDRDSIRLGDDWKRAIDQRLTSSDAVIAIVGKAWRSRAGLRELQRPDDYVRYELVQAITTDVPVIPLFVDNAKMPNATNLPKVLHPFIRRQGVQVLDSNFREVMGKVAEQLRRLASATPPGAQRSGADRGETGSPEGGLYRVATMSRDDVRWALHEGRRADAKTIIGVQWFFNKGERP